MPLKTDLRSFIALLEQKNQLSRITTDVNPVLEIAAVTDKICKQDGGGKALLFENPYSLKFSVATNLFGSHTRCALAFGVNELQTLKNKMTTLLNKISSFEPSKLDKQITDLPVFAQFAPESTSPLWCESQPTPNISIFPFLQNWSGDGSNSKNRRYITFGQVFTALPDGSATNCGMYRAQIVNKNQLAIHWNAGSGAEKHLQHYKKINQSMPVAIALGGDPALVFSSAMPLPGDLSEIVFAGFLSNRPQKMAYCTTVPLSVPATAEIVIEGFVDLNKTFSEGPFGNHSGFYMPVQEVALLKITRISHRSDAIIPATIVGPPPMEDCWMQGVWERLLLAILQKIVPEIIELHIPHAWSFHQSAIISIESTGNSMIRKISSLLWDLPWFRKSRILVFVSKGTNPEYESLVLWKCINLAEVKHHIIYDTTLTRIAIDATGSYLYKNCLQREKHIVSLVEKRWQEYGFV